MVRFGRTDRNQPEIVRQLKQIPGVSVFVLSDVAGGMTDLLVGRMRKNFLIELKDGSKLTPDQVEFHATWKGQCAVAHNLDDVLMIIGIKA